MPTIRSIIARWINAGFLLMGFAVAAGGFSGPAEVAGFIRQDSTRPKSLTAAREFVFKGEWDKARQALDLYAASAGQDIDEALYWLALSLDKLAGKSGDSQARAAFRTEAMTRLDRLIRDFPGSSWLEEGKSLRLEIAAELVSDGKTQYREIIDSAVRSEGAGSAALRLAALSALAGLDAPAAFPHIRRILETENDSGLRRKAVLLLGRRYSREAADLLRRTAKSDPDPEVRSDASHWLASLRPSQLTFVFFTAQVEKAAQDSFSPKEQPTLSPQPRSTRTDLAGLGAALTRRYAGKLSAIEPFREMSHFTLAFFPMARRYFTTSPVSIGDFQVRLDEGNADPKNPGRIGGRIILKDIRSGKEHPVDFEAGEDTDGLIVVRKGDRVLLIVLRFDSGQAEAGRGIFDN